VQARADGPTDNTAGIGGIAPERLVFIDESAVLTSMVRRYGRSPRGQRAYAKVPFGNWKRLSVLSALGIEGFLATMSVADATDGATFAVLSRASAAAGVTRTQARCGAGDGQSASPQDP
jgi:hypothetical protein